MNTTIVNLWGQPGVGKSTTAAGLFHLMKHNGASVELVTEYAKEAYWEERSNMFGDQIYLLAKQHRRISRLVGKVQYVITDSPIGLGAAYEPPGYFSSYVPLLKEVYSSFNNLNFLLKRSGAYNTVGRNETEEESNNIGLKVHNIMQKWRLHRHELYADEHAIHAIWGVVNGHELATQSMLKCPRCGSEFSGLRGSTTSDKIKCAQDWCGFEVWC